MTIRDKATPNPHTPEVSPAPGTAPADGVQERDLRNELARIQDQLTAEDRATGARPSPGATRRRAELLRRERDIIRQLRTPDQPQKSAPQRRPHHDKDLAQPDTALIRAPHPRTDEPPPPASLGQEPSNSVDRRR